MFKFSTVKLLFIFFTFVSVACYSSLVIQPGTLGRNLSEDSLNRAIYPNKDITDGPYIFNNGNTISVKWIEDNHLIEKTITDNDFDFLESNFGIYLDANDLNIISSEDLDYDQEYTGIKKFVALSDIHGQYFLFEKLLRKYGVINSQNNWSYGKGHLIINGDIFDRGDMVNEILWLVYKLEKQAEKKGGKVHYLIGNHEMMVLKNDVRYVNEKYLATAEKMGLSHDQLYSEKTLIGQWVRTKPIMVTINDIIFIHAGISPDLVEQDISKQELNQLFQSSILGQEEEVIEQDTILNFLSNRNGPVWYRGYFRDKNFNEEKLNTILDYFDKKRIVVGHTTQQNIVSLYDGKVIGIDAGIKRGKTGEVLIYKRGKLYLGTLNSGKTRL